MMKRLRLAVQLLDETEFEVIVGNPSMVAYERTAAKRGWPTSPGDSPVMWQTFLAWHSAKAQGLYTKEFTDFCDTDAVLIEIVEEGSDEVNPTQGSQRIG